MTLLDDITDLGIDVIRVMPQAEGTTEIIEIFQEVLTGRMQAKTALEKLQAFQSYGMCNGYWFGKEGMQWINKSITQKANKQNSIFRCLYLSGKR